MNRILLTAIAFMSYMIMAGLLTQSGVILNTLATALGVAPEHAVGVFSWLTGGALCGTFASLFLYSHYSLKKVLITNYSGFLVVMLVLVFTSVSQQRELASLALLLLGMGCGCGLAGGAVIISKIYHASKRASAFIATDCSFSASGYIFPSLAALLVASQISWEYSYGAVGVLAVLLWLTLFIVTFPDTEASDPDGPGPLRQFTAILTPRVVIMGLGVCAYLVAQTTFLTWAPNYLQHTFVLDPKAASAVVGNYWGMSIFGLISATVLVHKLPQRLFLMVVVIIACVMTTSFMLTDSVTWFVSLSYAFGFFTTCIYKVAISVGTLQIKNAPAVLVTFLLFSGSVGSTLAPAVSGLVVQAWGVAGAMAMTWLGYMLVALMFSAVLILERRAQALVPARQPA